MATKNVSNILAVYSQATAEEITAGREWYAKAHDECDDLHFFPRMGPGIVAALSPGLRWEVNIEAARKFIAGDSIIGLGIRYTANLNKAARILSGEFPECVLGGNKVRAFYRCILNPENRTHVCVDGHAYSIWRAKRIPLDQTPNLGRRGRYHRIAEDYCKAAKATGLLPNQIQAVTWCTWRRLHGVEKSNGHLKREAA